MTTKSKAGGSSSFASQQATQLIDWRSNDGTPEVITVTLPSILGWSDNAEGLNYPALPALLTSIAPMRAIVTWAYGGEVSNTAVIDYPWRGGTFTITASTVQVSVIPDQIAGFSQPTYQFMRATAFVGPGASRQNLTPVTFTDEVFLTAPGVTGIVPIPRYARAYWVEDDAVTAVAINTLAWTVTWQNRGPPGPDPGALTNVLRVDQQWVHAADQTRTAPTAGQPLPIPSRATHASFTRWNAPPVRAAIVYVLDLGA